MATNSRGESVLASTLSVGQSGWAQSIAERERHQAQTAERNKVLEDRMEAAARQSVAAALGRDPLLDLLYALIEAAVPNEGARADLRRAVQRLDPTVPTPPEQWGSDRPHWGDLEHFPYRSMSREAKAIARMSCTEHAGYPLVVNPVDGRVLGSPRDPELAQREIDHLIVLNDPPSFEFWDVVEFSAAGPLRVGAIPELPAPETPSCPSCGSADVAIAPHGVPRGADCRGCNFHFHVHPERDDFDREVWRVPKPAARGPESFLVTGDKLERLR